MTKQKELSIVFPLYNEAENIYPVVMPIAQVLKSHNIDYELVLVDNGSFDGTGQILENLSRLDDRFKKVIVKHNQGYGWGVICGLKAATGRFVGFMCGDGQIYPKAVIDVFNKLKHENLDIAKVKRVVRKDGLKRRAISEIYNLLFFLFFNVGTMDVNGTPKIFKGELLDKFAPSSKDWFIDAEIMIKAKELGLKIGEVPVVFLARQKGKSNVGLSAILQFLKNMIRYKFSKVR